MVKMIRLEQLKNNEALVNLYHQANTDGKDGLEGTEISAFKELVEKQGLANDENYKKLFGSEIKSDFTEKELDRNRNKMKDIVKDLVKNGVMPKDMMKAIKDTVQEEASYKEAVEEVQYVFDKVQAAKHESKEDIDKLFDTVKKQIQNDKTKEWNGFYKDILNALRDQARNQLIQERATELYNRLGIEKDENGVPKTTDLEARAKKLKDELNKKNSNGKKEWNEGYTKEAFKIVENELRKDGAKIHHEQFQAIYDKVDSREATEQDVKDELDKIGKSNDKYINDGVKDLKKNDGKILKRGGKFNERYNSVKQLTRTDLEKQLGKDLFDKIKPCLERMQNEDGTYDLSELADDVLKRVGNNYQADYSTDKGLNGMYEVNGVQRLLANDKYNLKVTNDKKDNTAITEEDAKKLVEFFDINVKGKEHTPKIFKAVKQGAKSMIAGAGGGASAIGGIIHVNNETIIKVTSKELAEERAQKLLEKGYNATVVELAEGGFGVRTLQKVLLTPIAVNILSGAGTGLVIDALWDLIAGYEVDEKSCMSVADYDIEDDTYTNSEKYKKYVANVFSHAPEKAQALQNLVDLYQKQYGDKWHEHFQQELRDEAGVGSKLNPEECRMLKYRAREVHNRRTAEPIGATLDNNVDLTPPQVTINNPVPPQKCRVTTRYDINLDGKEGRIDSSKYYWEELINMFYADCLKENGGTHTMKEIRFRLKKINNIPLDYPTIPKGLKMPYDLFEDGECTRTEQQDTTLRKRGEEPRGKVKVIKTPNGGWQYGTKCPGSSEYDWNNTYYATEEEALRAGNRAVGNK